MSRLDISHALSIPGWMSEAELLWLASQAHANPIGTFVEIGTYLGRSAAAIANHLRVPGILYCIDPYIPYYDPVLSAADSDEMDQLHKDAERNLDPYIVRGILRHVRRPSIRHAQGCPDRLLDFVFLDGNHTYPSVMADIAARLPKIRPGGILCGHDYTAYQSVKQAVDDSFRPSMIQCPADSIWAVTIPAEIPSR